MSLRKTRILLAATIAILLASCSDSPHDPWEYAASNIPADADLVAAINTSRLKELCRADSPLSAAMDLGPAEALLDAGCDRVLFVLADGISFLTWPLSDNPSADEAISQWEEISIGKEGPNARALASSNSVIIASGKQAWLFPSTTDVNIARTRLSNMYDDIHHGKSDDRPHGLAADPVAMSVINSKHEYAAAYLRLDGHPCTAELSRDAKAGDVSITLQRHDESGAIVPLSDNIIPGFQIASNAGTGEPRIFVGTALKRGTLANEVPDIIAPYLSITGRVALRSIASLLKNAEGQVYAEYITRPDDTGTVGASINFASVADAETAGKKILSLAKDRVDLSVAIDGASLYISAKAPFSIPEQLDSVTGLSAIIESDKATLRIRTKLSPAELLGTFLSIL